MPDAATICLQNPQENDDSLSLRLQESSPPPTALLAPTSRQQAGVPLTSRSQNPYHASTSTFYETAKISGHGVQGSGARSEERRVGKERREQMTREDRRSK